MAFESLLSQNIEVNVGPVGGILVNLALSTIVGGVVFLIITKLIARKFHESVGLKQVMMVMFLINIINIPVVWGFTLQQVSSMPLLSSVYPFLPLIVWFVVVKLVFSGMKISHSLLVSILGYILSLLVIPIIVLSVRAFLPF